MDVRALVFILFAASGMSWAGAPIAPQGAVRCYAYHSSPP